MVSEFRLYRISVSCQMCDRIAATTCQDVVEERVGVIILAHPLWSGVRTGGTVLLCIRVEFSLDSYYPGMRLPNELSTVHRT